MSHTLLELTQSILGAMEGDEVNSISDTAESARVAKIVEDVYFEIVFRLNPPSHQSLFELESSGNNAKPTIMTLPRNAREVSSIRYDNALSSESAPNFISVAPVALQSFLTRMYLLNVDDSNVSYFKHLINNGSDTIDIFFIDDKFPQSWTTYDNNEIIFDSYFSDEDTTLNKAKTLCTGLLLPIFIQDDLFEPNLAESNFSLLLNEAKITAFAEMRQTDNRDASRKAKRQWVKSQQNKFRVKPHDYYQNELPDYGRRRP